MIGPAAAAAPGVVLVVEDDSAILALVRATFERAQRGPLRDVRMVAAADLQTARRLIAAEAPDVVVMDVRLPDGNGLDLVRELRDGGGHAGLAIIIASASVLPAERDAAVAAGADVFLPKPYRPSDLVGLVTDLLPRSPG